MISRELSVFPPCSGSSPLRQSDGPSREGRGGRQWVHGGVPNVYAEITMRLPLAIGDRGRPCRPRGGEQQGSQAPLHQPLDCPLVRRGRHHTAGLLHPFDGDCHTPVKCILGEAAGDAGRCRRDGITTAKGGGHALKPDILF